MFTRKDAVWRLFLCTRMCGISQRARMAVRLRPWMDRMPQGAMDGGAANTQGLYRQINTPRKSHLLFLPLLLLPTQSLSTTNCNSTNFDEIATVRYIHDGDTLHLTNGKKIRLIGINTPELARDNKPAEAFATDAKKALKSLFKHDKSIALLFGKDKKDHYGRYLAHAFLKDGSNIQASMLQQGMARTITFPPNTRFNACYRETERSARCDKTGLWKDTYITQTKNLNKRHLGFQIIKGTVNKVKANNKGFWLTIDNKLTVGIRSANQHLFNHQDLNNMLNQTIIARGWINKSKQSTPYYLRIRHPASMELASTYSCN